jgi:hypothetical protein
MPRSSPTARARIDTPANTPPVNWRPWVTQTWRIIPRASRGGWKLGFRWRRQHREIRHLNLHAPVLSRTRALHFAAHRRGQSPQWRRRKLLMSCRNSQRLNKTCCRTCNRDTSLKLIRSVGTRFCGGYGLPAKHQDQESRFCRRHQLRGPPCETVHLPRLFKIAALGTSHQGDKVGTH